MEVTGKLVKFLEPVSGTSKAGSEWKKQSFIIDTGSEYDNILCFEVFGDEKVENLTKYQKEGDTVKVTFNIKCNEWKGKYFTSLSAWRIDKEESHANQGPSNDPGFADNEDSDSLPF